MSTAIAADNSGLRAAGSQPRPAETADANLLVRVRRIEIRTRRAASALLAGDYRSIFRGTGIEFAEAREYTPGDDVRRIDWNVTARMGTPWVKEYAEERELPVVCAVDISGSQDVAHTPEGRMGVAAEITALLAFAAENQHDRTALLTFADQVSGFVPPGRGTRHVLRLIRNVLQERTGPRGTSIGHACDYLARVLRRRSIVFLISDFIDSDYAQQLRGLSRRHEVVAITLVDTLDLDCPDLGIVEVEDAESGARLLVDTSAPAFRRGYAAAAQARERARHATLAAANVDEIVIPLNDDPVGLLLAYFRARAARR